MSPSSFFSKFIVRASSILMGSFLKKKEWNLISHSSTNLSLLTLKISLCEEGLPIKGTEKESNRKEHVVKEPIGNEHVKIGSDISQIEAGVVRMNMDVVPNT